MTHDRTDRIPLASTEPRCEPSGPCSKRSQYARYLAALPAFGAVLEDFSLSLYGGTVLCSGFVDAATLRQAGAPKPAPKPPIRGIA